ncbi:MAG: ABC transporter substrate-binding protein [Candidatus Bathyarchaeota archaeon]|nr:ABC transporter substrate-binding protein [Candidatus Bathyarchaeota archaeon]
MASEVSVAQSSVATGDPHICSDSSNRNNIVYSVYETLVKRNDEGRFIPSLARQWNVESDGLTWAFELRDDVKFHNGDSMGAQDVVASLNRVIDPAIGGAYGTQGVYASYIGDAEFKATRSNVVKIVTKEPMADLLDLLVEMPIGPEDELDRLPNEYIGTGPWQVAKKTRDEQLLTRFRDHWGEKTEVEEVTWLAVPDALERAQMVVDRDADISCTIGLEGKSVIEEDGRAKAVPWESGLCIIYMFNALQGPCTDTRVRQALNHGLDVDSVIKDVKKGAASRLSGYLTPHHYGYDPETKPYVFDQDKARRFLAEAGYRDGLKLVMDIPTTMPDEAPELAEHMKTQYSMIGVEVEVKSYHDRPAYAEMVRDKQIHDLCCFDSSPRSTFRVLREKLHSGQRGPWWQGYNNQEVDCLIWTAQRTFDYDAREEIYREIYRTVHRDAPWVFLYRPTYYWGVGSRMGEWMPELDGMARIR